MEIKVLKDFKDLIDDKKYFRIANLNKLIKELRKRELTNDVIERINSEIEKVNKETEKDKIFKQVFLSSNNITKILANELKIAPKKYYQRQGLAIGVGLGLPLGYLFAMLLKNLGLMGVGLPIGIGIGIAIGSEKDKKAFEEGRQLDVDMNLS